MRKNDAGSVDRSPAADAVPEQRYPQPDPQAFAGALAEVERELAGRRLSADGTPPSEEAIRRSTAWARALRRRGWPAVAVPYGPQPWADVGFLDEDGEPIDYSDAPELPREAWARARPNTLSADLWEADLARRVAELARDRREALGLTQEQVAERTGLPQSSVSRVETGRHLPSVATLARLAVALDLAWRLDVTPGGAQIVAVPAERAVAGTGPSPEPTPSPSPGRKPHRDASEVTR
jgi:transcriptional regulator with XRE-family HTH domain